MISSISKDDGSSQNDLSRFYSTVLLLFVENIQDYQVTEVDRWIHYHCLRVTGQSLWSKRFLLQFELLAQRETIHSPKYSILSITNGT